MVSPSPKNVGVLREALYKYILGKGDIKIASHKAGKPRRIITYIKKVPQQN